MRHYGGQYINLRSLKECRSISCAEVNRLALKIYQVNLS